jgi:hypothetical protein
MGMGMGTGIGPPSGGLLSATSSLGSTPSQFFQVRGAAGAGRALEEGARTVRCVLRN